MSGTPLGPRMGHSMTRIVEQTSGPGTSLLIFGGGGESEYGPYSDELALLVYPEDEKVRWESVELPTDENDVRISARMFHMAVFDESQQRLLVYGGRGESWWRPLSDMWELRWRPEAN